jgi:hypothetical protein
LHTHNGQVPRDHWLTAAERAAIVTYYDAHAPEGYRRVSFMMLNENVVVASPATVYRVLKAHGRLDRSHLGRPRSETRSRERDAERHGTSPQPSAHPRSPKRINQPPPESRFR